MKFEYDYNEEEEPHFASDEDDFMEFDTGINQVVQYQQARKEEPGYFDQVSNAYNQSKLVDYMSSEHNQLMKTVDDKLKDSDFNDNDKDDIRFYNDNITQSEFHFIDNLYRNGDYSYDFKTNSINVHSNIGKNVKRLSGWEQKVRGYIQSKNDVSFGRELLKEESVKNTRKEYLNYEKDLSVDEFFDNFGSQVLGNIGAYITDPVGAATLALEIATLGAAKPLTVAFQLNKAKGLFLAARKKGKFTQTLDDMDYAVKGFKKDLDIGRSKPKPILETTKWIDDPAFVKTKGSRRVKQIEVPIPIVDKVSKDKAQAKFMREMKSWNDWNEIRYNTLATITGAEAGVSGMSEALQQEVTFDFKHGVLPEFDETAKNLQIGLVAGSAGLLTLGGGMIGDAMMKSSFERISMEGENAVKVTDEVFKKEEVAAEGAEGATDEVKVTKTDDIKTEEELGLREVEMKEAYQQLEECLLNPTQGNSGINKTEYKSGVDMNKKRIDYDNSTRNTGGERYIKGEKSSNKGELSSGDIERARTGNMSRYKDESVPGSYNKQTWREFEVDIERQGFSKEEAKNIINNVYSLSGKARKEALRNMGIDLD